jgi:periplasmic divalent cation tolerance protein
VAGYGKTYGHGFCVVLMTEPKLFKAKILARGLVQERLAACVSLSSSITSFYHWEGRLCEESEILLIIKTRTSLLKRLKKWISAHHEYQIPEIIALPIIDGHKPYLDWISDNTNK